MYGQCELLMRDWPEGLRYFSRMVRERGRGFSCHGCGLDIDLIIRWWIEPGFRFWHGCGLDVDSTFEQRGRDHRRALIRVSVS